MEECAWFEREASLLTLERLAAQSRGSRETEAWLAAADPFLSSPGAFEAAASREIGWGLECTGVREPLLFRAVSS